MKQRKLQLFELFLCAILLSQTSYAGGKLGDRLRAIIGAMDASDEVIVWVYFADKGSSEMLKQSISRNLVTERSIQRRLNVLPASAVVDYTDLPVEQQYVAQIVRHVSRIRQQSKWFNAVSVLATKSQIVDIEPLSFVKEIDLVARFGRNQTEQEVVQQLPPAKVPVAKTYSLDYGPSLGQLSLMNVPLVHDKGNYGQGVIVGVFDNGFRLLTHEVFASMNILATHDFVDHKVSVVPNNPSSAFGSHGVNTLSTIGGYKPGQLIGPAFGATYILARTENDSSETPIEEDNWVAAIEWADSLGVQVTSTSLGYLSYDAPYKSWTWQDMNGRTTAITRAAEMAVRKGIVVLNSAGNGGYNPNQNTLNAPADGDSVLAVGAVDPNGGRSYFSSVGPTTSVPPHIKPDIMAQGSSVVVASSTVNNRYGTSQGTSFSCPLAAGVAALIVHDHPTATPTDIANALRNTASRASAPDNQYGWGIIDAVASINFLNTTDASDDVKPAVFALDQNYPNPFNPVTFIKFELPNPGYTKLEVYDLLGREVATLVDGYREAGRYTVEFTASSSTSGWLASGVYLYKLSSGGASQARRMILLK